MQLYYLLLLIAAIVCSYALSLSEEDSQPKCIKIDECSCRLKNVQNPGAINLHGLVSDKHEPRFVTEGKTAVVSKLYGFYYNPCKNFSYLGCTNTAICQQAVPNTFYDLGNLETVEFKYQSDSVVAVYKSRSHGLNKTSEVHLICDENEVLGKFQVVSEPVDDYYIFNLYTQCACPGKCKKPKVECVGQDLCTCELSDGTGRINLHSLDDPSSPMKDEPHPLQTVFYNPCSPIASPRCGNHSVCEVQGNSIVGLGLADTAKFVLSDSKQLSIQYLDNKGSTSSRVNLICDHGQRGSPLFRADELANTYDIYSVCACPGGCESPAQPPTPTCIQTDSCTCKSTSDNAVINLHDLDDPYAPLTTTDSTGYTYYYNPCSGLKIKYDRFGNCYGVGACQEDPFIHLYYTLGETDPKIEYSIVTRSFTFHYSGGQTGRSFDVEMMCDPKANDRIFEIDGDIPPGAFSYAFKLTTRLACF